MKRRRRPRDRRVVTILFTDLVGSTERAAELGDRAWRRLLEQHHAEVRRALRTFNGHEVDTAGDGFFAMFDEPAQAIRCACSIVAATPRTGLQMRAGVHTGEVEPFRDKVAGIGVHTGARIASKAGPGEVLVSGTTRELVAGAGFSFEDRGVQDLKGIPGSWRLYAVLVPEGASAEDEGASPRRSLVLGLIAAITVAAAVTATVLLLRGGGASTHSTSGVSGQSNRIGQIQLVTLSGTTRPIGPLSPGLFEIALRPRTSDIAFVIDRAGNRDISTMSIQGTGVRRLTKSPAPDRNPAWSPDGTKIAFVRVTDGQGDIYVMDADGSEVRDLTRDPADDHNPVWSPDGTRIAFVRAAAPSGGSPTGPGAAPSGAIVPVGTVEVMNADGSSLRTLSNGGADARGPVWSPDGTRLAFAAKTGEAFHLFVVAGDGSAITQMTRGPHDDSLAVWSPNGQTLAFLRDLQGNRDICTVPAAGGDVTDVTNSAASEGEPAWSPDGALLAFVRPDGAQWRIWTVSSNGSGARSLVSARIIGVRPYWLPDGSGLLYVRQVG